MAVTININGELILDQTAGLQDDDVNVDVVGGVLANGLDSDFLAFLNGLGLLNGQENFAALVEGASDPGLVTVDVTAGETIGKLFFSDASGNDFDGDLVPGVTTIDGDPLFFWSANNGKVVLVSTSNVAPSASSLVAAFYIESNNAQNTAATVQSITFAPLLHGDPNDPDDTVDFSDVLRVSAVITQAVGDDIHVDDDAPTIVTSGVLPVITVDETFLGVDNSASFAANFTSDFGTDGGDSLVYALGVSVDGADSGLIDTLTGDHVLLRLDADGNVEGYLANDTSTLSFEVLLNEATGEVTLDQQRAVVHDPNLGPNDTETLDDASDVTITATITDADGDEDDATNDIGHSLVFVDDAPDVNTTGVEPTITLDETNLGFSTGNFAPNFATLFGNDGDGGTTFALNVSAGAIPGLTDTNSGEGVNLTKVGDSLVEGRTALGGLLVFSVSVDASGVVTFTQARSVIHANANDPNDARTLGAADLITLTATVTDGDGDQDSATLNIGDNLVILDDGPVVTVPSSAPDAANAAHLGNQAGQSVIGGFGYDIGADDHGALFYAAGGSDFVDVNPALAGVQISLTGTVNGPPVSNIIGPVVTLQSETADDALFNWSFTFDADPLTGGVQVGTASGTLLIDKDDDTFTIGLDDPVEGFSFTVLHTNELLAKAPPGNTGHPEIVVTELDVFNPAANPPDNDGFYVQFTANSNPSGNPFGFNATGDGPPLNDTVFNAGQMISSNFEDWVSATQTTNGVAGDTIQKGELLTLRFFNENIMGDVVPGAPGGGTERLTETDAVQGIAIKFDGIGNSEDMIMVLDLINEATLETTTKSVFVQNSDIIKGAVPAPYNTEFSLDNNDGLVIIESNDFNNLGENWSIQGVQIMQSGNGLTGTAINLNGAVGASGGSSGTQAWEATDNDVLKIVDIGFIETTSGTQTANLDFAFNIADGDQDLLGVQHINALISNAFIV